MDGVLVCDKAAGMTSHDVVARVRRLAGQRRVGHGGTLDPPATGVLVLALGRATRLLPFLPTEPKRYLATVAFGAETDTLDAAGTVTATADAAGVDEAGLRAALAGFVGPQEQVPPMVSAIKVGGERLYAKARRGAGRAGARRSWSTTWSCSTSPPGSGRWPPSASSARAGPTSAPWPPTWAGPRHPGPPGQPAADGRWPVHRGRGPHPGGPRRRGEAGGGGARPGGGDGPGGGPGLTPAEAAALATGRTLDPTGRGDPVAAVGPDGRLVAVIQDSAGRARPKVVLA